MKRILLLLTVLSIALPAFAQEATEVDSAKIQKEVVISAAYDVSESEPFTYCDVPQREIERKNFGQEPSFILAQTPGISCYSDAGSNLGYSYFRMRGIDQTRINMTLDGVPLNEPEDQGVYFSNYPDFLNSVSKIQIQRGVGTSNNGTASYAGSIRFKSPVLAQERKREFYFGYGSFGTYRLYGEYNSGVKNKTGVYARISHLHSNGFKERSANTSTSGFYSACYVDDSQVLKFTGFVGTQKNQMAWLGAPLDSVEANPRYNANTNEDDRFTQTLNQLQHVKFIGEKAKINTALYYNYLGGNYDFDLNNFLGLPPNDTLLNYALRSHFGGLLSNFSFESKRLDFYAGIHGNLYSRKHIGSENFAGQLYENTGFKNEMSAFAKAAIKIWKLHVTGDVQVRHTNFDYKGDVEFERLSWTFVSPKLGISWRSSKKLALYYSIGSTSREPTRNDLFLGWDNLQPDSSGTGKADFANIVPESVLDQEIGWRWHKNGFYMNNNLYLMVFRNEIVLNGQFGPTGLALRSNVASSFRAGIEIEAGYETKWGFGLANRSSFSYNRIRQDSVTFAPVLTPGTIITQEIYIHREKFRTGFVARYQGKSYLDFANENEVPSFFTLDYNLAFTIKVVEFSIALQNITNRTYYSSGSVSINGEPLYHIQAPFNYLAGLRVKF